MERRFEISKRLSREHQGVASLLGRLELFLLTAGQEPPHWQKPETRQLMSDVRGALRAEIPQHFAIEEQSLFPLFAEHGGEDLVELLLEDHRHILDLVAELRPLVEQTLASPDGLTRPEWETFRAQARSLVTELGSHAEKEELGFVPAMDELMEPATAKAILDRYLQM